MTMRRMAIAGTSQSLRRAVLLGLLLAGFTAMAPVSNAQTAKPTFEPRAFAAAWLAKDCALGESTPLPQFVDARVELVPIFVRAFQAGPPQVLRGAAETGAREAFARRQAWLAKARPSWIDAATLRSLLAETADASVVSALRALDAKYRRQALNGLALAGGPDARKALEAVAADPRSAYRQTAIDGLRRLPSGQ